MIEAKKREMSQQLAELEDGSDGPDEFDEGNIVCNTGQRINELENGPSSYRQKGINFEWVFMK